MLATALTIAEIALVIGVSTWIALEKRSPVATLAWILLVTLLPVAGPIVYYLIGYRRVKRSRLKRLRARLAAQREVLRAAPDASTRAPVGGTARQLMALGTAVCAAPPSTARSLTLLVDGDETFAAIEAAIRAAKHHVHLEYYIFDPDQTGTRIRDLLVERAKAGVEVRLLCDGVGSLDLNDRFLAPLRAAGAKFAWFSRVRLARLRPRLVNFRTHRKIVVVDGLLAFTGGVNVTDDEVPRVRGQRAFRDTHLRVEGAAARWLQVVFLEDWGYATGHAPTDAAYFPDAEEGPRTVQILSSGPDEPWHAIHKLYFAAINAAEERVLVATPYFVPDEAMLTALSTAALRGVEVELLVPRRSDSRTVTWAARSYFRELLDAGVRIFEYTPSMMHAKTLVVDEGFAAVGTANMDARSFRLNYEVTAVAYDAALAGAVAESFARDRGKSHEVTRGALANERLASRVAQAGARLLSPLL